MSHLNTLHGIFLARGALPEHLLVIADAANVREQGVRAAAGAQMLHIQVRSLISTLQMLHYKQKKLLNSCWIFFSLTNGLSQSHSFWRLRLQSKKGGFGSATIVGRQRSSERDEDTADDFHHNTQFRTPIELTFSNALLKKGILGSLWLAPFGEVRYIPKRTRSYMYI